MGRMKYQASFSYADADSSNGRVSDGGTVPLLSFTVISSGPLITIDFSSTDDMDIAFAMKQVVQSKDIYVYLPATRGIEIVELVNYANTPDVLLKMSLMVTAFSGGIETKSLLLISDTASISKYLTPYKKGSSVQLEVRFKDAKLRHTSHTVKIKDRYSRVVYSQWKDF